MASCSMNNNQVGSVPATDKNNIANAASNDTASNGTVNLAIDAFGGMFKTSCYTDIGFYDQLHSNVGSINIMYTDFATKQRVYLCNKPDCVHNNDSCTSWFSYAGGVNLFASNYASKIFLLSSGYAENEKADKAQFGRIVMQELDGSNRQTIYSLSGNEAFTDAIAMDNKYIYATVISINKNAEQTKEVRRINFSTGSAETIHVFESSSERVFGAYENYLIIENATASNKYFYTINIITNKKSENIYGFEYTEGLRFELIFKDILISLRQKDNKSADIYTFNFSTLKEELLASDFAVYSFDAVYIKDIIDNRVILEVTDNRDVNNIVFNSYNINLDSKELTKNELTFKFYADTRNVTVLAEFKNKFLVESGVELGVITLVDNAGVPYFTETAIPTHSLIDKNDFWNNIPNYEKIENKIH